MIRRLSPLLPVGLLALCLVLTGVAAGMAQTRMAASGGACASTAPRLLLDAAGLPVLDADGAAIPAPDCPLCHLPVAAALSAPQPACQDGPAMELAGARAADLPILSVRLEGRARAPPRLG